MKKKLPPLVMIEWVDSVLLGAGWRTPEQLEGIAAHSCWSVGFLIKDEKQEKLLAGSVGAYGTEDEELAAMIVIPACSIIKMTEITSFSYRDAALK